MREILFKAKRINWRKFQKEEWWIEGLPSYGINGEISEIEHWKDFANCEVVEIDPETLCQYTGPKDKDGNRIWENDIVDGHEKRGTAFYRSVVIWNEVKARFDVRAMQCNFPMTLDECDNDISIGGLDYRVIGNVFDNPELLERS